MSTERIVVDGEAEIGRGATLWHRAFGAVHHDPSRRHPAGGAAFRAPEAPAEGDVLLVYSPEHLRDAWEDLLFESPQHAEDVVGDRGDVSGR